MQWLNPKAWLAASMGMGAYGIAGGMSQIALYRHLSGDLPRLHRLLGLCGQPIAGVAGLSSPVALVQSGHGALAAAQRRHLVRSS